MTGEADMSENVMYDSPLEMMQDAIADGSCDVQSVVPLTEGGFRCACSCERWQTVAPTRDEGLRLAKLHAN
nr:hypothetical protein GCM10017611_14150 [Rhodococcus wratislaviensis]GLK39486.1 hypothetical protein GCM10017611_63570 [Rhodococcus wratislaviensis]